MSCGRTGRLGNISLKKETTYGTYVTPDVYLRAASESINRAIDQAEDEALVGQIYTTEKLKVGDSASGSIDGSVHGDTIGILMNSVLGDDTVSNPSNAVIVISYSGSDPYIRLTKTGSNLLAEKSADGSSWSADTAFNTTGTIDLSTASFDTATELATAIDGYTGYHGTYFGAATGVTDNIADFAATIIFENSENNGAAMLHCVDATSTTAKRHTLIPAGAGTCLPSHSITVNRVLGTDKSIGFVGTKSASINLTNSAKDLCKYSLSVVCQAEEIDKTDVALTLPEVEAFLTANMKILVIKNDGTMINFNEVKDFSLTINTNPDENIVIGSYNKQEPVRQNATIDNSFTANNTATQYAVRPEYTDDKPIEIILYFTSNSYADTGIPYQMIIRQQRVKLSDYNSPLSTKDRLVITAAGIAELPKSSVITNHIEVDVIDNILTTY